MIHYYKKFLSKEELVGVKEYMESLFFKQREKRTKPDPMVKNALCVYGDPVMDYFLCSKKHVIEKAFKKKLLPTYTYSRLYTNGQALFKHKDRPACEISLTLNIWQDVNWPIFMEGKAYDCKPGEAVFYEGGKYEHWREAYEGETCCQIFMHYVDAKGNNTDQAYDGLGKLKYPKEIYQKWFK
jgi:hypothetical protein